MSFSKIYFCCAVAKNAVAKNKRKNNFFIWGKLKVKGIKTKQTYAAQFFEFIL